MHHFDRDKWQVLADFSITNDKCQNHTCLCIKPCFKQDGAYIRQVALVLLLILTSGLFRESLKVGWR